MVSPSRAAVSSPRLALLDAIAAADEDIVERKMGGRRSVFVNDPHLIGEILARNSESFEKSDTQRFILGKAEVIDILLDAQAAQNRGGEISDAYVITERQIRDDLITMFITGTENPRNALSWALYLLGRHPDVCTSLVRELREGESRGTGAASFHGMPEPPPLLLAVLNEALRLYPPGYAFGRRPVAELEIGPLRLTPETEVVISPYVLHRRTRLFARPHQFDPGRFSAGAERALPPHAFLPFGAGPRGCIGGAYSLLEGQAVLSVLLRRSNLHPVSAEPIRPELLMTLRPSAPIWMRVGRA